ncbi:hypothetical protein HMI54_002793 [Coelomomyces lativittatus]|nr:hypothetical protein HMI56_002981 [Coelomomyces lativittatus]KAJ1508942.1 hypothetical protein HMI54_002793 [Coelomomyces lativittatus]KAJ1516816.1 hypothetical protein HMI55_001333 [Coelomomyces lativittatus]
MSSSSSSTSHPLRTYSSTKSTTGLTTTTTSSSSSSSSSFSLADLPPTQAEFAQSELPCLHQDLQRVEQEIHKTLASITQLAHECALLQETSENIHLYHEVLKEGDQLLSQLHAHTPVLNAVQQNMIHTPYKSKDDVAHDYETQLAEYLSKNSQIQSSISYSNQLSTFLKNQPAPLGQDEDITVTRDADPADFLCPVTGAFIDHLWIAQECGHPYEKDTIVTYLNQLPAHCRRTECLYSGCVHYISLQRFKEDKDLEQRMKRNRVQRQHHEYEKIETISLT